MKPRIVIEGQQLARCFYIFGDTLFDNGNNNNLITLAKANYLPYGIDYIYGNTGRFTNDANIPDFLAQRLGFSRSMPPFATAGGTNAIVRGLNYASGGGGILDETSNQVGDRMSMNKQLNNHQGTVDQIAVILGNQTAAKNLLNQCLYIVNMGNDDYILNYYFQPPVTLNKILYTPETFAQKLIQQYSQQLTRLYNLGARKVAVFGIVPIGCIPNSLSQYPTQGSECVDSLNNAAQIFNNKLISLINNLNANLPAARFTYINFYGILSANLSSIGVRVTNSPCCEVSLLTLGLCVRNGGVCSNRNEYTYFDNYHPTGVVNNYTTSRAYNAQSSSDATPTDIATLVAQ
ncbi:hypothetical protein C2S53_019699 [Perilla frutescens var. hirtella]|uniref:Uncharacterized protein n=1 Tax=Perilla frutescens var. hirtella TaxID=608512 RepID=A0AAD4IQN7_PERFH|nr:hypothetical protein C2S53_019699 [Perilla frutescens var. hirtella]